MFSRKKKEKDTRMLPLVVSKSEAENVAYNRTIRVHLKALLSSGVPVFTVAMVLLAIAGPVDSVETPLVTIAFVLMFGWLTWTYFKLNKTHKKEKEKVLREWESGTKEE